MNIKRFIFWAIFLIILVLIVWGLAVAMNKPVNNGGLRLGQPAAVTLADHIIGPITAPVTLIEYSDFQCPACKAYYTLISQVLASSSVPVRLVYRHYPLPQHANALPAAMASEAAGAQGKFAEMYDLLFENHTDWIELPDPKSVFMGYATKIGLDIPKFTDDLASSTLKDVIKANLAEGQSIGVDSTPTFFVNGKAITNPTSYDQFESIIEAAATGGTN
ncbi:MAG: thioredoxin domain-containing protein [Candidatus Paceibacterota bacterium]